VFPVLAAALLLAGCASPSEAPGEAPAASGFPAGAAVDYQLGGAYPPPDGVGIVARDSTAEPAPGVWSICYVNGFQTQPGEEGRWDDELTLRDADGGPVIDPNWPDERLLDTSDAAKRERIARVLAVDVQRCADSGFDAVEFDNLDSFSRTDALTVEGNLALAQLLVDHVHELGLLAGQKNSAELAERLRHEVGFDFAVAEECLVFRECGAYTDVYGDAVIDIEYTDEPGTTLEGVCADAARPASTVLRDRDLVAAGEPGYEFGTC